MHLYVFLFSDVQFKKKVKEQDLSKTIHSFIKASESGARKSVYFAYLVGPTVQVCSFLFKDIPNSIQAGLSFLSPFSVAWFWRLILCKLAFFSDCDQKYLVYNFHSFININVNKLMSILQINGENYLLPIDLKSPSSRADLIHSSLNINWLVKQLSKKYVCIFVSDLYDIFYLNLKLKEEYVSTYITSWQ